jgi:hypothetical protein
MKERAVIIRRMLLFKKSGKFVSVQTIKAYRGRRSIAPFILNLDARWRRVINITPRPLYPHDRTPVPTGRRLGWSQRQSRRFGGETITSLAGMRTPVHV